jgi:hypothetical protein
MHTRQQWLALALAGVACALSACTPEADADAKKVSPAVVTEIEGSDVKQVALTQRAAERIALKMGAVAEAAGATTVPYAAVVYDKDGSTWVYTSPEPLTFVRTAITVEEVTDETAILSDGPAVGTGVVVVGTAELFGAEQGIGY